jgi:hypothetical protein
MSVEDGWEPGEPTKHDEVGVGMEGWSFEGCWAGEEPEEPEDGFMRWSAFAERSMASDFGLVAQSVGLV